MPITRILDIEDNLASLLVKAWQDLYTSYTTRLLLALKAGNKEAATKIVNSFSLAPLLAMEATFKSHTAMAFKFGAQQVSSSPQSENDMSGDAVDLLKAMIQQNVAEQVKKASRKVIEDFGKVKKADEPYSILNEFQSFAGKVKNTAEKNLRLAAQLHTSRLAAYGATAEFNVLGIKEYTVNAQLDKKCCPVCRVMHGRVFQVSDARALLKQVLGTKDPDKISEIQPWPNVKDAKRMALMSSASIVSSNWHIPPRHPACRCLLIKIKDIPELSIANRPSQIASGANDLRYKPNEWDFVAAGLDPIYLKAYEKAISISPMQLLARLFGEPAGLMTRDFLTTRGMGVVLSERELVFNTKQHLFGSQQPVSFKGSIDLLNKTGGLDVLDLAMEDSLLAKDILASTVEGFKQAGLETVAVNANVGQGSFAMAKYGFAPRSALEWSRLKKIRILPKWKKLKKTLPPKVSNVIDKILASDDPKAIWDLADITYATEKGALGEYLLKDGQWWANLELKDPHSMMRFNNYFSEEPLNVW